MTMKHTREDERVESSIVLLGSDHSKKKRQRTLSVGSESSTTENRSSHSNTMKKPKTETSTLSPRMIALLNSLEALDDGQQRQIKQQWPLVHTPAPTIPLPSTASTNQVVSTLLKQKQQHLAIGQPLTARPAIHKIEEHPVRVSGIAKAQVESRDASSQSPSMDTAAINTIKRAVAAAAASVAAPTANTLERTASPVYTGLNAALAQHRIRSAAFLQGHPIAPTIIGANGLPLSATSLPTLPGAVTTATTYGATPEPSARQLAIHAAVHSDYRKIYKPLQRPPRLPTPREALVVAAISTAR